jgi:hypothetical protein
LSRRLPAGMPHSIFNIDDNVALTENYLFPDGLPDVITGCNFFQVVCFKIFIQSNEVYLLIIFLAIAANKIAPYVPSWNESLAYR